MGGIIRCIKNDYNLDQIENEINQTDSVSGFDEIYKIISQNNNPYIDFDDKKTSENIENSHYIDNFLEKKENKRNKTFSMDSKVIKKLKKKY